MPNSSSSPQLRALSPNNPSILPSPQVLFQPSSIRLSLLCSPLPSAAVLAAFCRGERETLASGYQAHSRAYRPSLRTPRPISLRLQPMISPFSGTAAPQPALPPDSVSPPWKHASPASLTRGDCFFQCPMNPGARRQGRQLFLFSITTQTLLFPFCLQISLLFQSLSPTPCCHSYPLTSCSFYQLETSTPGPLPSTPAPTTMCQQDGHCTNNTSAYLVLEILFWGSLFHYTSVTQIHGQLPDLINRNHTWAKILNPHTLHSNTPSHPSCSCALSIFMAKNSLPSMNLLMHQPCHHAKNPFLSPFVPSFVELRLYDLCVTISLQHTLTSFVHHSGLANSSARWPQVSTSLSTNLSNSI